MTAASFFILSGKSRDFQTKNKSTAETQIQMGPRTIVTSIPPFPILSKKLKMGEFEKWPHHFFVKNDVSKK